MKKQNNSILDLLKSFNPSKYNLLKSISKETTDDMLEHIANADYGFGRDKCYPILKEIRNHKIIKPDFHVIHEEISLTRWTIPKNEFDYILTTFNNCIALIMGGLNYKHMFFEYESGQLAGLICSILNLDKKHIAPTLELISWRLLTYYQLELEDCEDIEDINDIVLDVHFVFALFLLSILNKEDERKIQKLLTLLISTEKEYNFDNGIFIFYNDYKPRHQLWKDTTKSILSNIDYIRNITLRNDIIKIKECIINEKKFDEK